MHTSVSSDGKNTGQNKIRDCQEALQKKDNVIWIDISDILCKKRNTFLSLSIFALNIESQFYSNVLFSFINKYNLACNISFFFNCFITYIFMHFLHFQICMWLQWNLKISNLVLKRQDYYPGTPMLQIIQRLVSQRSFLSDRLLYSRVWRLKAGKNSRPKPIVRSEFHQVAKL